jgi:hypothetical protein
VVQTDADSLGAGDPEKKNDTEALGLPGVEGLLRRDRQERSAVKPDRPKKESHDACDHQRDGRVPVDASKASQGKQKAVEDQQLPALGTRCKARTLAEAAPRRDGGERQPFGDEANALALAVRAQVHGMANVRLALIDALGQSP